MIVSLPDDPALAGMSEADLRVDLACGLFAAGRVSRSLACRVAGMERHAFDRELAARHIASYTSEMVDEDLATLDSLFPR